MSGGQSSASGQGSLGHGGFSIALSGQVITVQQESLEDQHGQVFFAEQGSLSGGTTIPNSTLTQVITSATGTLTYVAETTGDKSVHLGPGQEASFLLGASQAVIGPAVLSGQSSTSAAGSVTQSAEAPLVGSSFTASAGFVIPNVLAEDTYIVSAQGSATRSSTVPLVGESSTCEQEDFAVSSADKEITLSSVGMQIEAEIDGVVLPESSVVPFEGMEATEVEAFAIISAQENIGAPGVVELSGVSMTTEQGFLGRSYAVTGQEITSSSGTIVGLPGIVALVGSEVSVQQGSIGGDNLTIWTEADGSTTTWTESSSPSSAWTPKPGSSTTWTPK
jgi:hypothetical protein